ncbi:MarR family winged helix-turn-helix transcriptional regulator [Mesorhizobium japonicum]|uniref:MarR family winged helix-turn-helix transcriptional regulator n=1 Tax=Mesorhizobium japonicum TaxID=2066070 RepID=UPI003B5BCFBD
MSETNRLSEDEFAAWNALRPVLDVLPAAIDSRLMRSIGMTQLPFFVLVHLHTEPAQVAGLSGLAACADSALPRMSRVVGRLEGDGLVERAECVGDGRAINVHLTAEGAALVERALPIYDGIVRELLFDAITPEERAMLHEISNRLMARLHPDSGAPLDRQQRPEPGASRAGERELVESDA